MGGIGTTYLPLGETWIPNYELERILYFGKAGNSTNRNQTSGLISSMENQTPTKQDGETQ